MKMKSTWLVVLMIGMAMFMGCNKTGPAGRDGSDGLAGSIGPKGDDGATGPQGQPGEKGDGIIIARYDGVVTSDTIYIHCSQLTADTPVEVYLGMTGYDTWMPVGCSGIVWYYVDITAQVIVIKNADCAGWDKYRIFAYLKS
jgi:hypothetical protein